MKEIKNEALAFNGIRTLHKLNKAQDSTVSKHPWDHGKEGRE